MAVEDPERVSYLTQTTLAVEETVEIVDALRARFPGLRGPGSDDICYATTNRQHALAAVAVRLIWCWWWVRPTRRTRCGWSSSLAAAVSGPS